MPDTSSKNINMKPSTEADVTRHRNILVVGCSGAGKTALVKSVVRIAGKRNKNKKNSASDVNDMEESATPTTGVDIDSVVLNGGKEITLKEIGSPMMAMWPSYFESSDSIMYVIDASNAAELSPSCAELWGLLSSKLLTNKPVLVVLNKCEQPFTIPRCHLKALLNMEVASNPSDTTANKLKIRVQEVSCRSGIGIQAVIDWMGADGCLTSQKPAS